MKSIKGETSNKNHPVTVNTNEHHIGNDLTDAVQILQLAHDKYSTAKKQLEDLHHSFEESEIWVGHKIKTITEQHAFSSKISNRVNISLSHESTDTVSKHPLLQVHCLGNFQLFLNFEKVDKWHSQKARSMIKYILTRRKKAIPRDELIEALWPNCAVEVGRNNLKAAVYSLRQTLATCIKKGDIPHIILFQEGQYFINPEVEIMIDIDEFERYWHVGRRLEREGKKEKAIDQYKMAEEIYKGDYFEDDPYSEWTLLQREALKDNYLTILGKLASYSFETFDYESCSHYSQLLLYKDICHEEAYRWLIKCNIALEQYNRAHRWFKVCADVLRKELDATLDQKTIELYYHLVQLTTGKNMFSKS